MEMKLHKLMDKLYENVQFALDKEHEALEAGDEEMRKYYVGLSEAYNDAFHSIGVVLKVKEPLKK